MYASPLLGIPHITNTTKELPVYVDLDSLTLNKLGVREEVDHIIIESLGLKQPKKFIFRESSTEELAKSTSGYIIYLIYCEVPYLSQQHLLYLECGLRWKIFVLSQQRKI